MKYILKPFIVLSLIAIVAGALLGFVNDITYVSPEELLKPKLILAYKDADSFNEVKSDSFDLSKVGYSEGKVEAMYIPVKGGVEVPNTYLYSASGAGSYPVTLLIVVVDNKITNMVVVATKGTPGIGDKAYKDKFTNQFKNKDITTIDAFEVVKVAETEFEVSSVAGSTKSCDAVTNAVNNAIRCHKAYLDTLVEEGDEVV